MANTTWGDLGHYSDLVKWWQPAGAWSPDPRIDTVDLVASTWGAAMTDPAWAAAASASNWTITKD